MSLRRPDYFFRILYKMFQFSFYFFATVNSVSEKQGSTQQSLYHPCSTFYTPQNTTYRIIEYVAGAYKWKDPDIVLPQLILTIKVFFFFKFLIQYTYNLLFKKIIADFYFIMSLLGCCNSKNTQYRPVSHHLLQFLFLYFFGCNLLFPLNCKIS